MSARESDVYEPKPIDTDHVALPASVVELMELLAEHVHDVWARGRIAEGWRWGPRRDDTLKQHPCLVPYAELPDSEKQVDRETARQTVAAILSLGYRIER